jgi:hypothetical protein
MTFVGIIREVLAGIPHLQQFASYSNRATQCHPERRVVCAAKDLNRNTVPNFRLKAFDDPHWIASG